MDKKIRISLWVIFFILLTAGLIWWQAWRLGKSLRTASSEKMREIVISEISPLALASDLMPISQDVATHEALLDRYRADPNLTHQRYLLVMTWLHASQIQKMMDWGSLSNKMLESGTLSSVPLESRVDGWNDPFCIWIGERQVAFMSSGGKGRLRCSAMEQFARSAITSSHDARLAKAANILVTVQRRPSVAKSPETH